MVKNLPAFEQNRRCGIQVTMKLKTSRAAQPASRPRDAASPGGFSGAWLRRYGGIFSVTSRRPRASRFSATLTNQP
jgi:hypothetical protein